MLEHLQRGKKATSAVRGAWDNSLSLALVQVHRIVIINSDCFWLAPVSAPSTYLNRTFITHLACRRDLSWMNVIGRICEYQSIRLEETIDNLLVLFKPTFQKRTKDYLMRWVWACRRWHFSSSISFTARIYPGLSVSSSGSSHKPGSFHFFLPTWDWESQGTPRCSW